MKLHRHKSCQKNYLRHERVNTITICQVALIQSKNNAANKEKTAGRYQFDTLPTGIGLTQKLSFPMMT